MTDSAGRHEGRQGVDGGRRVAAFIPADIIRERIRRRRRLADARALAPRILAADPALAACGPRTVIAGSQLTSTNVAVIVMARPDDGASAVLKIPMTAQAAQGMERESRILAMLHSDERLGDWRRLIPRPRATGALNGRRYRIDVRLRGDVVRGRMTDHKTAHRLLEAAAETIHGLHRATATEVEADAEEALGVTWKASY